jgi:predicted dehydrogenase
MKTKPDTDEQQATQVPRRDFMKSAAMAAAGVTIVPRHVLGGTGYTPPSDLLNIAGVGVGGMGRNNMINLSSQNIVALCDVDWGYAGKNFEAISTGLEAATKRLDMAKTPEARKRGEESIARSKVMAEKFPKVKRYTDYRQMLDQQKDIDAVMIATPDHLHATIAAAAMKAGKHVYVQKPLTWSVAEARELSALATANPKLATQMGNQGHSTDDARLINEYIQSGAIGDVAQVHVWTNRPLVYWPQGIPRPENKPAPDPTKWGMNQVMDRLATAMAGNYPKPQGLEWDLFLGPGPVVDYHPVYHPFNWRGWTDWGCGAIGDMGAHLIDHPFWALELGFPTSVETVSTPFNKASYPMATVTHYEFAARGSKPAVRLTWYDGALLPATPEELGDERVDKGGGVLYIGTKGKLIHETYGENPRLLPKSLHESTPKPAETFTRIKTTHEMNWVEAAKGITKASSPFEYAARLTETMLLGVVSLRAGGKINYDGENMRITNIADANQYLKRDFRQGWSL